MVRVESLRRLALAGLAAAALAVPATAQSDPPPWRPPHPEVLEQRWRELPEAERRELEERLQRFRTLPEADRRAFLERARVLREQEREWRKDMPPRLRHELDELPPDQRRERWKEHLTDRFRARGHELRSRMPPELRERLEGAPPPARRHLFEELRRRHLGAGPGMGPPPLPPHEWERLPPGERLRRAREHFRRGWHGHEGSPDGRRPPEGGPPPPGGRRSPPGGGRPPHRAEG